MVQNKDDSLQPRTTYVELCNVAAPNKTPIKSIENRPTTLAAKRGEQKDIRLGHPGIGRRIKHLKDCHQSLSVNDAEYIPNAPRSASGGHSRPKRSALIRQHSQNDPSITPRNIHFIVNDDLPSGTCLSCVFHSMPGLFQGNSSQCLPSCSSLIPVMHDPWYNKHYIEPSAPYANGRTIQRRPSMDESDDNLERSQHSSYGNYLTVPTSPGSRSISPSSDEGIVHDVQNDKSPNYLPREEAKDQKEKTEGGRFDWSDSYYNTHSSQYGGFQGCDDSGRLTSGHREDANSRGRREDYSRHGRSISDVGSRRILERQPSEARSEGSSQKVKRVLPEIPQASSFLRLHLKKPSAWKRNKTNKDVITRQGSFKSPERLPGPSVAYPDRFRSSITPQQLNNNPANDQKQNQQQQANNQQPVSKQPSSKMRHFQSFDGSPKNQHKTTSFTKRSNIYQRSKTVDYSTDQRIKRRSGEFPKQRTASVTDKLDESPESSSSSANVKNTSKSSKKVITKKMNNEVSDGDENGRSKPLPPAINVTKTASTEKPPVEEAKSAPAADGGNPQQCLAKRLMEVGPADPQRVQVIVQDVLYEMGAERILQYKEAFGKFDKDCIGTISSKQLRRLLRTLGHNPRDDELRELVNQVDMDENGKIDFNEFIIMVGYFDKANNTTEDLSNIFRVYDNGGSINVNELRGICSKYLTETVPIENINEMIEFVDRDGDGEIERDELCRVWTNRW